MGWFQDNGFAAEMDDEQPPAPGWVRLQDGGWVPPDHPLAIAYEQEQQTNPGSQRPMPPSHGGNDTPQDPKPVPSETINTLGPTSTTGQGVLEGWDGNKWASGHNTPKYKAGRIFAKYPATNEGIKQAWAELKAVFPNIKEVSPGKIDFGGDLGVIDVMRGAASGGNGWQWIDEAGAGAPEGPGLQPEPPQTGNPGYGGNTGAAGNTGVPAVSPYNPSPNGTAANPANFTPPPAPGASTYASQAFTPGAPVSAGQVTPQGQAQTYTPTSTVSSQPGYQAQGGSAITGQGAMGPAANAPTFQYGQPVPGSYQAPTRLNAATTVDPMAQSRDFTYDPLKSSDAFKLPTGQEALDQDPGYQFRLQQGQKQLEQSAAGRGLLRTGGTLKDINAFGQQAASQEYGNAVGRSRDTYALNQGVRQSEQGQQFGQGMSAAQQNEAQKLSAFNARLAASGQNFQQAATQQGVNAAQGLAGYQANLAGQQQGYQQGAGTAQQNATNNLNTYAANSANFNAGAGRDLAAQQANQASGLAYSGLNSNNANTAAALNQQAQMANQASGFNYAGLNSSNANTAAALNQQGQMANAANSLNANQFNATNALNVNQQNNAFGQQAAQFNANQGQQQYQNQYNAANQQAAYGMQQQGLNQTQQQINLTQQQQQFMQGLSGQQQQWMQRYMENGQSFDQSYQLTMMKNQYPT